MSGPLGSSQWMYSSGAAGYQINDSLRFEDGSSAYLSRTPASTTNRRTMTFSFWMKRGLLTYSANYLSLFSAYPNTSAIDYIAFSPSSDSLRVWFNGSTSADLITTQVFRDPASWYHIVVAIDTTQATSSNRIKIYVNGNQVTTFSTANYPALNYETYWNNSSYASAIGANLNGPQGYFDGYLSDIHFIDGQALDPTSFGQFTDGYWEAKDYAGTYGTNSVHLDFNGNTNDASGNGNNWTANNISAHDYVPDSPTNNFATINPLAKSTYASMSEGNLKIVWSDNASAQLAANPSTITLPNSGKWYFELSNAQANGNNGIGIGICDATQIASGGNVTPANYYLYRSAANNAFNGYYSDTGSAGGLTSFLGSTPVVGIAVDLNAGKFWAAVNNTWQGSGSPNPATGTDAGFSSISNCVTWVPFVGGWEWTGSFTTATVNSA